MSRSRPNPISRQAEPVAQPSSTAVARLAGVSQSSVSRVFTPGAAVSESVREKVLKAAEALHYRPNALPAILQTGRSGIIAVIVGGFYNPFYTEYLWRVVSLLREQRREAMVVHTASDDHLDEIVGDLSRYRIDGVISTLSIRSRQVATQLEAFKIPVVAMNSRAIGTVRCISSGNLKAGAMAADVLHRAGCRRMAYLAGRDIPVQSDRQKGFVNRLRALGLPEPEIVGAGFNYEDGHAAATRLLSARGRKPDGIFCVNDLVAIGALDAIRGDFGLSVPDDIQVIGFDDVPMAAWKSADLTTFHQDMDALAAGSVALLSGDTPARPVVVPTRLVLRGTTRRPETGGTAAA
ncbi:LacI family DNA-binding transcriptional regulator [Paraburkholderia acidisoli]|uniref:LacI family DNA-binding transcriptional regulator n=1 Tax=Paraburkholderia acidisoli TaxID=2571748 RepID=A0A7Z2GQT7_9BURK|nr:LacI family DNA-binding transcriptional regulator [Paraburkholderia acidisoli]QGZ66180.1 LacI family DNA-binding transcriptional regulator [Paraburkholderia acidisoli]